MRRCDVVHTDYIWTGRDAGTSAWKKVDVERTILENNFREERCAFDFAKEISDKKTRKDGREEFIHEYRVNQILYHFGVRDEAILSAALLHDTVEDEELIKIGEIADNFSVRVTKLVYNLSVNQWISKKHCLDAVFADYGSKLIKLADRLHNFKNHSKNLGSSDFFSSEKLRIKLDETIIEIIRRYGLSNHQHPYAYSAKCIALEILREIAIAERKLQNTKNSTK